MKGLKQSLNDQLSLKLKIPLRPRHYDENIEITQIFSIVVLVVRKGLINNQFSLKSLIEAQNST